MPRFSKKHVNEIIETLELERQQFLLNFALFLQSPTRDYFAAPNEIRSFVHDLFYEDFLKSDTPEQVLTFSGYS